jgi:hypothetical protein
MDRRNYFHVRTGPLACFFFSATVNLVGLFFLVFILVLFFYFILFYFCVLFYDLFLKKIFDIFSNLNNFEIKQFLCLKTYTLRFVVVCAHANIMYCPLLESEHTSVVPSFIS